MSDPTPPTEPMSGNETPAEFQQRRDFLQSMGKWSGAAIIATVAGGTWIASSGDARAARARWVNRRGGGGAAWANRAGWVNRGGGWLNGRGGGGAWVNRRTGGGAWVNRR